MENRHRQIDFAAKKTVATCLEYIIRQSDVQSLFNIQHSHSQSKCYCGEDLGVEAVGVAEGSRATSSKYATRSASDTAWASTLWRQSVSIMI
jgi:hypothetical protein